MKSAYELAMERLNKQSPTTKLTERQKKELAELESKYKAKVAEREIALKDQIAEAAGAGDFEKVEKLEQELAHERKKLLGDWEEKRENVRKGKKKPTAPVIRSAAVAATRSDTGPRPPASAGSARPRPGAEYRRRARAA